MDWLGLIGAIFGAAFVTWALFTAVEVLIHIVKAVYRDLKSAWRMRYPKAGWQPKGHRWKP